MWDTEACRRQAEKSRDLIKGHAVFALSCLPRWCRKEHASIFPKGITYSNMLACSMTNVLTPYYSYSQHIPLMPVWYPDLIRDARADLVAHLNHNEALTCRVYGWIYGISIAEADSSTRPSCLFKMAESRGRDPRWHAGHTSRCKKRQLALLVCRYIRINGAVRAIYRAKAAPWFRLNLGLGLISSSPLLVQLNRDVL